MNLHQAINNVINCAHCGQPCIYRPLGWFCFRCDEYTAIAEANTSQKRCDPDGPFFECPDCGKDIALDTPHAPDCPRFALSPAQPHASEKTGDGQ
jgi:hypothetical protein